MIFNEVDMDEVIEVEEVHPMDMVVEVPLEDTTNTIEDGHEGNIDEEIEEEDAIGIEEEDIESPSQEINLFLSLESMGLEVDEEVCKDLIDDTFI